MMVYVVFVSLAELNGHERFVAECPHRIKNINFNECR